MANARTFLVKRTYDLYPEFPIEERYKSCSPKIYYNFAGWLEGSHKTAPFITPMTWSEHQPN